MKIFIAGASGAIGQPLIDELIKRGHSVTGMTHSTESAKRLQERGAHAELASALDGEAVASAMRRAAPEVVIDQLTSLPKNPADMPEYLLNDRKLRDVGGDNLHRAAQAVGARRYIQQSSGFYLAPGDGQGDESTPLAIDAGGNVGLGSQMYALLEKRVLNCPSMEGVAMRYGFFYGPNTWYHKEGAAADNVRQRLSPIIGKGEGIWCFVHIEDAAKATVAALEAEPGIYQVVDNDPSPVSVWLPKFAQFVGAPPPPRITEAEARVQAGDDAVYYATKLRAASNEKARRMLEFKPRQLEWL